MVLDLSDVAVKYHQQSGFSLANGGKHKNVVYPPAATCIFFTDSIQVADFYDSSDDDDDDNNTRYSLA